MSKTQGYTLIELMIIVMVIAVFAAIAIPSYQYIIAKTYQAEAQAEMQKQAERLESFRGKQLTYAGFIPEAQDGTNKGQIYLPYDSTSSNYNYQLNIVDINDTSKSLEDSPVGQGWKIVAVPNQSKSSALRAAKSFMMDSRGLKCESDDLLTVSSTTC